MIKIGIIGGAGYTAGELLRILVAHPKAEITFVHSYSNEGNPIASVHTDLVGDIDKAFTNELKFDNVDVIFLCMGHGVSRQFMEENKVPASVKVIDLSHDYRIENTKEDFVYGLPELNKADIKKATRIANPGCFATCIQQAVLPLAAAGKINSDFHVNAITGSTGAGQSLSPTSHFSWRSNNISIYKAFSHQHLREWKQSVKQLQPSWNADVLFLPMRGDFTRGIYATSYIKSDLTEEEAKTIYKDFYKDATFTHVVDTNPNLKQVVNTNKCLIYIEKHDDQLLIISMIDNLVKGASGQAIHNMNLMFGLPENTGLQLKATAF